MSKKMIKSIFICLILTFSFFTAFPFVQAASPHTVKGILYINDEIPTTPAYDFEKITVKLVFTSETYNHTIYEYNLYADKTNYNVGLFGHEGETANIIVKYYGHELVPKDNKTITIDTSTGYIMNLHITVLDIDNIPPNKPTNPKPENNSENISLNPVLSIFVADPDKDNLFVNFYNASDDQLIDSITVSNASNAQIIWPNLSYNTSYHWYVISNDSEFETVSDVFTFKTIEIQDYVQPNVFFEKPEEGSLYIFDSKLFSGILKIPFILGKLNIVVNATDNHTGISKVELSIVGKWQNITENLTKSPYTYEWSSFGFKTYNITATAYDNAGNSASTNIIVRKFL